MSTPNARAAASPAATRCLGLAGGRGAAAPESSVGGPAPGVPHEGTETFADRLSRRRAVVARLGQQGEDQVVERNWPAGIEGARLEGGAGCALTCCETTPTASAATNGGLPVVIS